VGRLRANVSARCNFTVSAGIAANKMLAKLASAMHKPDQQTVVPQCGIRDLLDPLPVGRIRGLGGKMGQQLREELNVTTIGDLASVSLAPLVRLFGDRLSLWMWQMARGIDPEEVKKRELCKSLVTGKGFPRGREITTLAEAKEWIRRLCGDLHWRIQIDMKRNERVPTKISIAICTPNTDNACGAVTRQCALPITPVLTHEHLVCACNNMLEKWTKGLGRGFQIYGIFASVANFVSSSGITNTLHAFKGIYLETPDEFKALNETDSTQRNISGSTPRDYGFDHKIQNKDIRRGQRKSKSLGKSQSLGKFPASTIQELKERQEQRARKNDSGDPQTMSFLEFFKIGSKNLAKQKTQRRRRVQKEKKSDGYKQTVLPWFGTDKVSKPVMAPTINLSRSSSSTWNLATTESAKIETQPNHNIKIQISLRVESPKPCRGRCSRGAADEEERVKQQSWLKTKRRVSSCCSCAGNCEKSSESTRQESLNDGRAPQHLGAVNLVEKVQEWPRNDPRGSKWVTDGRDLFSNGRGSRMAWKKKSSRTSRRRPPTAKSTGHYSILEMLEAARRKSAGANDTIESNEAGQACGMVDRANAPDNRMRSPEKATTYHIRYGVEKERVDMSPSDSTQAACPLQSLYEENSNTQTESIVNRCVNPRSNRDNIDVNPGTVSPLLGQQVLLSEVLKACNEHLPLEINENKIQSGTPTPLVD